MDDAAEREVEDIDQALADALAPIDKRTTPYLTGIPFERRLINLAIYVMPLVSDPDQIKAQTHRPIRPAGAPLACQAARNVSSRPKPREPAPKTAAAPFFGATVRNQGKWRRGRDSNPRWSLIPILA
jgi:hypothetical protein